MGEIGHSVAVHFQIDGDGRTAKLRMGGGAGVRVGQPSDPRDRPRKLYDPAIVDLVEHCKSARFLVSARVYCLYPPIDYIGADTVKLKFGFGTGVGGHLGCQAGSLERKWTPSSRNCLGSRCPTTCTMCPRP